MSAPPSNVSHLPHGAPVAENLAERTERVAAGIEHAAVETWHFLRFLLFVLFLVVAVLSFWLWVVTALIGLVRFVLKAVMLVMLFLSGGLPPRPGAPAAGFTEGLRRELETLWAQRLVLYEDFARPAARHVVTLGHAARTFWHWRMFHKAFALVFLGLTVFVPALYVVPRPHDVQISDDNAVAYDKATNKTTYLVHGLDLHVPGKTREYINEDAWYFGKINSQGLKSQLQVGRHYRLWVVGVRWYYLPTLYPNIIRATELDEHGNPVKVPRRLAPAPKAPPEPGS